MCLAAILCSQLTFSSWSYKHWNTEIAIKTIFSIVRSRGPLQAAAAWACFFSTLPSSRASSRIDPLLHAVSTSKERLRVRMVLVAGNRAGAEMRMPPGHHPGVAVQWTARHWRSQILLRAACSKERPNSRIEPASGQQPVFAAAAAAAVAIFVAAAC